MSQSTAPLQGTIRGRTIELDAEPGLPDGRKVAVTIEAVCESIVAPPGPETEAQRRLREAKEEVARLTPGEGLRRSAGGWAEDAEELDRYLEWNRQQRKLGRPELEP